MKIEQAYDYLVGCVDKGTKQGLFTLEEVHIALQALNQIKSVVMNPARTAPLTLPPTAAPDDNPTPKPKLNPALDAPGRNLDVKDFA